MSYAAFLGQARGEIPSGLTCCYIAGGFLPSKFLRGHHGSPFGHARLRLFEKNTAMLQKADATDRQTGEKSVLEACQGNACPLHVPMAAKRP